MKKTLIASIAALGLSVAGLSASATAATIPHGGGGMGGAHGSFGGGGMGGAHGSFGGSSAMNSGGANVQGGQFRGGEGNYRGGNGWSDNGGWHNGGNGWRGGRYGGYGWGWGPFAAGALVGAGWPYYYDDYGYGDGYDYGYDNGCIQYRPLYNRFGQFIGRRAVNVCP